MVEKPPEQRIDDPEDLSQTKRIREILDRRRETLEARDIAKRESLFGDVNERDALLYYRSVLESLIYDLWNVFRNYEGDEGKEYLNEKEIATIQIPPPKSLIEEAKQLQVGENYPDAETITIRGLRWYIEHPEIITAEFSVRSLEPPKRITKTASYVLQWSELDAGLRDCFEFIDTAGIDAELADEEQQTKIDRELLEEVDEWRRSQPHINTD